MLSRDHIVLSIFSCFIIFGWLFFQTPPFFIAIAFGVFIGCLLPDTDLEKSKIDRMKGIPGFFGMITRIILNPLVAMIFELILKKPIDRSHRGVTHTFYGILTYSLIIEAISIPIIILVGMRGYIAGYSLFVFGLFFGGVLHLMEDSCTKSGILPFYPINEKRKYSGNISTYDLNEKRPKLYALFLLVISVFLFIIQIYSGFPFGVYIFLSVASFVIVWKIIITISKK